MSPVSAYRPLGRTVAVSFERRFLQIPSGTDLQTLWLSVLAVPLTLLQKRPAKPSSPVETAVGRFADGKRLYFLCSEPDACWQLAVVRNLAEWAAAAIQVQLSAADWGSRV